MTKNKISRIIQSCFFLAVGVLLAADPSWKAKQVAQWNRADANQVLAGSPWVKRATPAVLPQPSEAQLRDGGRMGGGKSVGLDRIGPSALTGIGGSRQSGNHIIDRTKRGPMVVRWESSLAIRTAELKAGEAGARDWEGDYYAIAVYEVPDLASVDQRSLGDLKRRAFLKRDGKKDLKPERVEVVLEGDSSRVVYLFPRTGKITAADKRITFTAQIGQLCIAPLFNAEEMQLQGKLEL